MPNFYSFLTLCHLQGKWEKVWKRSPSESVEEHHTSRYAKAFCRLGIKRLLACTQRHNTVYDLWVSAFNLFSYLKEEYEVKRYVLDVELHQSWSKKTTFSKRIWGILQVLGTICSVTASYVSQLDCLK